MSLMTQTGEDMHMHRAENSLFFIDLSSCLVICAHVLFLCAFSHAWRF